MKLLLSLILLISLVCSLSNAIKVTPKNPEYKFEDQQNCADVISQLDGFSAAFDMVSYNSDFNDQQTQSSFYENGYISTDFKNQQMMAIFTYVSTGYQVPGSVYMFAKNQTQYVLMNGVCNQFPFTTDFPSTNSYTNLGPYTLGMVKTQILQPNLPNVLQTEQLIVDSEFCSPLVSSLLNSASATAGYTMMSFYGYKNITSPNDFNLPFECTSPYVQVSDINSIESYPKFLKRFN